MQNSHVAGDEHCAAGVGCWPRAPRSSTASLVWGVRYSGCGSLAGRQPSVTTQPLLCSVSQRTWGINYSLSSRSSSGEALSSILIKNLPVKRKPLPMAPMNGSSGVTSSCWYPHREPVVGAKRTRASPGKSAWVAVPAPRADPPSPSRADKLTCACCRGQDSPAAAETVATGCWRCSQLDEGCSLCRAGDGE